jgi:transposase
MENFNKKLDFEKFNKNRKKYRNKQIIKGYIKKVTKVKIVIFFQVEHI